MRKKDWIMDVLIVAAALLLIGAILSLAGRVMRAQAADAEAHEIMERAQERIDAYYASQPARERPVEVPAAPAGPVVAVKAPDAPDWYVEGLPLDYELQRALWDACEEFSVDYALALAVIEQETRFQNLIGDDGDAIGYFQVQPYWWGDLLDSIGVDDLTDPAQNFRAGCAILRELLLRYDGSVADALTAYNSGRPGESAYAEAVTRGVESLGLHLGCI